MSAPDLAVDTSPRPDWQAYRPKHQQSWADSVTEYWSRVGVLDFICGMLVVFAGWISNLPIPSGVLVAALICARAAWVTPRWKIKWGGILLLLGTFVVIYLGAVSMINDTAWTQRTLKFVILFGLAGAIAQRRIDVHSFLVGFIAMAVLNVGLFYLGVAPNRYPPYLTGFFDDKNVAGFYYALLGVLGLLVTQGRKWTWAWIMFSGVAVFLTGSRTSISAFVLALAWIGLRNRVAPTFRVVLTAFSIWLLVFIEETFARIGMFADRTGTDWFREQIEIAMQAKVDASPWYGMGLNEGFVMLGGVRRMWFHNSYLQAFVEGGWVFLLATLAAFVIAGLGLFSGRRQVPRDLLIAESSIVVVLVCSWKLGEVFMTVGGFIALGLAIGARFGQPRSDLADGGTKSPLTRAAAMTGRWERS